MKAFLLTAAAMLACAGSMFAQNLPPDYNWEVGVNAGLSTFTRPLGPSDSYKGTRTNVSHDYSIRAGYFFTPNWMLNVDIGTRQWVSYGQWKLYDLNGRNLESRDVTFLVADKAISSTFSMNYIIPFYSRYNNFNRSNLNFGVTVGMINTVNDNSITYSRYNSAPDPGFKYVSQYNYGYGIGYTVGVQTGYTYYILPRIGLNIDLAVRYAKVATNDTRYNHENSKFSTLYFPESLGLRVRF